MPRHARLGIGVVVVVILAAPVAAQAQPVGGEFQINTSTLGSQSYPSVGTDAAGNFVVVWEDYGVPGYAVRGQRYSANGSPLGSEFVVTGGLNYSYQPSMAVAGSGKFVVVWQRYQFPAGSEVFGQVFDAAGTPQGTEFQVNTYTTNSQRGASVAVDGTGNFVVVWNSYGQDGSDYGVFARRFQADGTAIGAEFQVNTYTTSAQYGVRSAVAMTTDGRFVVVWNGFGQDGSGYGILGQRFKADGTPDGSEFQVNTYTTNDQRGSVVAVDPAGNFVAVWQSLTQDGSDYGVFGRRFSAVGTPLGAEFQVNTYTTTTQNGPVVTMGGSGNFVVVWQSYGQDGSSAGVFGQQFNSDASPRGAEFQVNTYTTSGQRVPAVAMDAGGKFVVAWQSLGQDGSSNGIFGQRYEAEGELPGDGKAVDYTADMKADLVWRNHGTGQVYLWTMNGASPTATSPVATVGDLNWQIVGQGDFDGDGKSDLVWHNQSTGQVYLWLMNGSTPTATTPVTTVADLNWRIVATADFNGDGKADLCWHNRSTGQVYIWLMNGSTILASSPVATISDLNWRIVVARDFTGDSKADLVWYNRSTGAVYLWPMNGATPTAFTPVATIGDLNWRIVAGGDYNGDGKSDLVWHNRSTGQVYIWFMNGATPISFNPVTTVADLNWGIVAAGDFGADGKADLVWYNRATGQVYLWQMNGATPMSTSPVSTVADLNWGIVHTQ
jgi:hypothetical protein